MAASPSRLRHVASGDRDEVRCANRGLQQLGRNERSFRSRHWKREMMRAERISWLNYRLIICMAVSPTKVERRDRSQSLEFVVIERTIPPVYPCRWRLNVRCRSFVLESRQGYWWNFENHWATSQGRKG